MKPVLAILALVLGVFAFAQESAEDAVVLRLGDESISRSEFDQRFEFYLANVAAQQGLPLTEETRPLFNDLRGPYLEQLATERLVLKLGRQHGLSVSEEYVDEQVARIREQFESDEAFAAALEEAGVGSEERLRRYLAEAELSRQTVAALRSEVEVPDYLLQLAYDANRDRFSQPEQVCARHILVETEEEATAILADLEAGASFETLASERSLDPGSAAQGGDLGCFGRGMTVPEFEEVAFATPVGEVSAPVESSYGFHLILPYERHEAVTPPLSEVEEQLRENLELQIVRKVIEGYRESADLELFPERIGVSPEENPEGNGAEEGE